MAKNYQPEGHGLAALGLSAGVRDAMLDVGRKMAGNANAVGESKYEAKSVIVRAGWANERRHGASVAETEHNWKDSRDAVLVRVAEAMKVRGAR